MNALARTALALASISLVTATALSAADDARDEHKFAACMWEKAPSEAQKALDARTPWQMAAALANGGEACGADSGSVVIEKMRRALRETKPKNSEAAE